MSAASLSPQSRTSLRAIALAAALYVLAWSLLPPLLSSSLPLDVAESLSWGREWQWGYYKHPPLAPWVLEIFYRAFGHVGPFLLSQLFIAATLWLVWRTGCRLMSRDRALLGALLTMGVAYYTRPALEFNHNIAQMPLWAATGYCLLAALQDGRMRHWVLLGVAAGLGLLTKYSVGLLLATLALYLLLTPERRVLRGAGPWVALAVMAALFAPHLHWLWQTNWLPMAYAQDRASGAGTHGRWDALAFVATQAINHLPLALIVLAAWIGSRRQRREAPLSGRRWQSHCDRPAYLWTVALGPCLLVVLVGLAAGLRVRDMWGVPMWVFSGLLVAAWLPAPWLAALQPRLLRGLVVWLVLISVATGLWLAFGAQWRHRPSRTDWPQAAIARQALSAWQAQSQSRCPLDSVSGDYWAVGLVAAQLPERPSVYIAGDPRFSPWITPERLRDHGTLWIGLGDDAPVPAGLDALAQQPGMQVRQGQVAVDWPYRGAAEPLAMHWRTYVPAACVRQP